MYVYIFFVYGMFSAHLLITLTALRTAHFMLALRTKFHGRGLFLLLAVATGFYMLKVPSREAYLRSINSFAVDSEKL